LFFVCFLEFWHDLSIITQRDFQHPTNETMIFKTTNLCFPKIVTKFCFSFFFFSFFFFFFFFDGTGVWTTGFTLAKQDLYCLS
jgi:hypothetical protein